MSKTLGRWEQQTPFTDGQIFIPASIFVATAGAVTLASAGAGLLTANIAASTTVNLIAPISTLLRTGQLATAAYNQEQFGTAASVPGPSGVANTSDPLDLPGGFPPWLNSVNPALTGGVRGPVPKGLSILVAQPVYEIDTAAATSVQLALTQTAFAFPGFAAAPIVSNILSLQSYGLPTAANTTGQAYRRSIVVTNQNFITTDGTEVLVTMNFTTPASSTIKFYGVEFQVSYNYN